MGVQLWSSVLDWRQTLPPLALLSALHTPSFYINQYFAGANVIKVVSVFTWSLWIDHNNSIPLKNERNIKQFCSKFKQNIPPLKNYPDQDLKNLYHSYIFILLKKFYLELWYSLPLEVIRAMLMFITRKNSTLIRFPPQNILFIHVYVKFRKIVYITFVISLPWIHSLLFPWLWR